MGPLALDVSGGADVAVDSTTKLSVDLSGGGKATIQQVSGPVAIELSGGGDIGIGHVAAPAFNLASSGGGNVSVGSGTIGALAVQASGSGNVHIGADVNSASIDSSGSADVTIAKVTGPVDKAVNGAGTVTIGGQ